MKVNLNNKKVLFLGYGAVAKCVWNYFDEFFIYKKQNIFIVDRTKDAFTGPKLKNLKKEQKIILNVNTNNFNELIKQIRLGKQDIIIDLSTSTPTYYIIKQCFIQNIHYINTSIEDSEDQMLGTSINCQQQMIQSISDEFKKPKSTILTEFGQNPGLIQHYVLYALNELNNKKNDFRQSSLQKVIRDLKIGTILMSEIDHMKKTKYATNDPSKIYNTWSVNGFFSESLDKTELVHGKKNKFIQPTFPNIDKINSLLYPDESVFFLTSLGIKSTLNSICPILCENQIKLQNFRGKLIHHGEMFELARYFGDYSPFMSYVYQTNTYLDESIQTFYKNFPNSKQNDDLWMYVNQENTFHIFNGPELSGDDSVGCTIFCGDKKIDKIYWCGSILSSSDPIIKKEYTPTIVQVAAGVLSGLSFILEHEPMGWVEATDLDTNYILEKSKPMLGKFLFMEIPTEQFKGPITFKEI